MLELDPDKRISAEDAMNSPWLCGIVPDRMEPPALPEFQHCHELWSKKRRRQMRDAEAALNAQPGGRPSLGQPNVALPPGNNRPYDSIP